MHLLLTTLYVLFLFFAAASSMRTLDIFVRLRTNPEAGPFPCTLDSLLYENLKPFHEALFQHFLDLSQQDDNDIEDDVSMIGQIRVYHRRDVVETYFEGWNGLSGWVVIPGDDCDLSGA